MKDDRLLLGMPYVSAKFVEEAETVKVLKRERRGRFLGRVVLFLLETVRSVL